MAARSKVAAPHAGRTFTIEVEGAGTFVMRPMSARQFIKSIKGEWSEDEVIETLAERCVSHPYTGEDFLDGCDMITAQSLAAEWIRQHHEAPVPPAHGGS